MTKIDYKIEYELVYLNLVYVRKKQWYLAEDMEIVMFDDRTIIIPKGFETDLSSIPSFLWGLLKPFDEGLLADLIHDYLYASDGHKAEEIKHFGSVFKAQRFADQERDRWRKKLAKEFPIKNWITYKALRIFGGKYYRGEKQLPK